MEISIMFTCPSNNILEKCRPLWRQVTDLVSSTTAAKDYGTSLNLLLANVVIQDIEWLKLRSKLSRKGKDIRVDVPLGLTWVWAAKDSDLRVALVKCLIQAVEGAKRRLARKDDDFAADKLIADLKTVLETVEHWPA
jgi:hypothetical protein